MHALGPGLRGSQLSRLHLSASESRRDQNGVPIGAPPLRGCREGKGPQLGKEEGSGLTSTASKLAATVNETVITVSRSPHTHCAQDRKPPGGLGTACRGPPWLPLNPLPVDYQEDCPSVPYWGRNPGPAASRGARILTFLGVFAAGPGPLASVTITECLT